MTISIKSRPNPSRLSSRTTADLRQPPFRATAAVCRRPLGRWLGGSERPETDNFRSGPHTYHDAYHDLNSQGVLTKNVTLETNYEIIDEEKNPTQKTPSTWARQLNQVAKLIKVDTTELGNERAAFITIAGGWDTHATSDLSPNLDPLDQALKAFVKEMKAQRLWDNVTILCASDFGRTLTSNSQGTDHAWGGNYFVLGGSVKGEHMLGKYPSRPVFDLLNFPVNPSRLSSRTTADLHQPPFRATAAVCRRPLTDPNGRKLTICEYGVHTKHSSGLTSMPARK